MASTASGSQPPPLATASTSNLEERPQARPLPTKTPLVGEIGYQAISDPPQGLQEVDLGDGPDVDSVEALNAAEVDALNGRHPADRSNVNLASQSSTSLPVPSSNMEGQPNAGGSTTSLNTMAKRSILSFHSLNSKAYHGITFKTLSRLILLLLITCAVICAWVFAVLRFNPSSSTSTNAQSNGGIGTSSIFIHVAFAIFVLILLVLLERTVFQLRAERYAHLHPGENLSQRYGRGASSRNPGMAFAPWNRPSLPTYAAALGVRGTGDVEDSAIAAPPPPEYGNTRGSTLLLSSVLRHSRASNRSRASAQGRDVLRLAERISEISARSLPISYNEVEFQSEVERARALEEALAKLEDSHANGQPSTASRS